ncbi:MAG: hypothetical protein AAFO17_07220 [Pseudomonadota bacterium]
MSSLGETLQYSLRDETLLFPDVLDHTYFWIRNALCPEGRAHSSNKFFTRMGKQLILHCGLNFPDKAHREEPSDT